MEGDLIAKHITLSFLNSVICLYVWQTFLQDEPNLLILLHVYLLNTHSFLIQFSSANGGMA